MRAAMPVSVMKPIIDGDRQRLAGKPERDDRPDQRERNVAHDDEGKHRRAIAAVENGEDQRQREQRKRADGPACLFLRLERAFEPGEEAFRQLRWPRARARIDPTICAMSAVPSVLANTTTRRRAVLAQDLVRPVGLLDVGELPRRDPARRRFDQQIAKPLRGAQPVRQPHRDVEPAVAVDDARHHARRSTAG